jgi:hypothetical protein
MYFFHQWYRKYTYNELYAQLSDGTVFVYTGDIYDMWIRDSAAQMHPLLFIAHKNATLMKMVEGERGTSNLCYEF